MIGKRTTDLRPQSTTRSEQRTRSHFEPLGVRLSPEQQSDGHMPLKAASQSRVPTGKTAKGLSCQIFNIFGASLLAQKIQGRSQQLICVG